MARSCRPGKSGLPYAAAPTLRILSDKAALQPAESRTKEETREGRRRISTPRRDARTDAAMACLIAARCSAIAKSRIRRKRRHRSSFEGAGDEGTRQRPRVRNAG